jgi:hypothetical protein
LEPVGFFGIAPSYEFLCLILEWPLIFGILGNWAKLIIQELFPRFGFEHFPPLAAAPA